MKFSDQIRYNIIFQQVFQKLGESEINYIKIFQNVKDLEISVGNSYTEYRLMHAFLEIFQQGGKYSARIASPQSKLRIEKDSLIKNHYLYLTYKLVI